MTSPPWTLNQPNIRFDLTKLPKSDNSIYHHNIKSLLREYANYTICLSDGSKINHKTAYAYSISGSVTSHRIHNISTISTAELTAIFSCLSHLTQLPPHGKYLLLTDSLSSLHSLLDTYSPNPLTQRIHLTLSTLASINTEVTFIWIPGHINLPEHDAVDAAAKLATKFPKITDPIAPLTSDYKNYFRSKILSSWNLLWKNQNDNKLFSIKKKNPVLGHLP